MQFRHILLTAALSQLAPVVTADPIFIGYYPTWKHDKLSKLDLSNYTHMNFAFGLPDENGNVVFEGNNIVSNDTSKLRSREGEVLDAEGHDMMSEIAPKLQAQGTKVLVSIGGWTGSAFFSNLTKPERRETFANNVIELMKKHNLDGVDFDWEYPGQEGHPCNFFNEADDTRNFLEFLQMLRPMVDALGEGKLITMAVLTRTFAVNGEESKDVSEFAKVVNYLNIMQYDINGPWGKTTAPNAPLKNEEGKGTQVSFATAIKAWTDAKWPAAQIISGLAFYGHSMTATVDMLNPLSQYANFSETIPHGDQDDEETAEVCPPNSATTLNETAKFSGEWTYANLRAQGVLVTPTEAMAPWVRNFDEITQTPWLFNTENKTYISYDDPVSIEAKIRFGMEQGLAGAMVWEISGDFNGELASAVRQGFTSINNV